MTEPLTGARYPASTDPPNGPTAIQNALADLSGKTIPYCTSTTDRDNKFSAWVAAGHTMRNGLHCYVEGLGDQVYENGAWGPAPLTATLAANWSGSVYYSHSGKITTVNVAVTWNGPSTNFNAWDITTVATGLPGIYLAQNAVTLPSQNNVEVAGWQFDMTNTGSMLLKCRWTARTMATSTWFNGAFSYITT